ncbi:hypothetical protein BJX65DRAFT_289207 [Aspergillus insuetus]
MTEPSSSIPNVSFDNIINFRDVGRTINQFAGKKLLKEGVLFRSARLDEASKEDIRRLTDGLNIRTIIDLRSTTEHHMAITKYKKSHSATTSEREQQQQAEEDYIHLPSLSDTKTSRHLISLTGRAFVKQLLWRLDWWNFAYAPRSLFDTEMTDGVNTLQQSPYMASSRLPPRCCETNWRTRNETRRPNGSRYDDAGSKHGGTEASF